MSRLFLSTPLSLRWKSAAALLLLGAACALPAAHAAHNSDGSDGDGRDAYALVHRNNDDITMSGDQADLSEVRRLKKTTKGDFLYFRHDGKAWLLDDAALLARIDAAWLPTKKLGAQMDAYGRQMDQYGKVMDGYGRQMDALARKGAEDEAVAQQMKALGKQMSEAGKPMHELGKQMDALGKEQGRASREADQQVRDIIREALGKGKASAVSGS